MSEITSLRVSALGQLIDRRELTASEVLEAHLKRIEEINPTINAITDLQADRAREQAAQCDRHLSQGFSSRGWLYGVPMAVKSSIAAKGFRHECGTRLRQGVVADHDATLVKRLKKAGANILGTTNVPEFLMAYETDNALYGRTNSPLDPEFTPGGSSGGDSAAVAAGFVAGSFGSDAGGSIRVPAHFCGLYGLKPTPGNIPRHGHWPPVGGPSTILAGVGPIARTGEDLRAFYETVARYDGTELGSQPECPECWEFSLDLGMLRTLRIGWFDHAWNTPVTAATRSAVQDAAKALGNRGFQLERIDLKGLEDAPRVWWQMFGISLKTLIEASVPSDYRLHPLSYDAMADDAEEARCDRRDLLMDWVAQDRMRVQLLEQMNARKIYFLLCPVAAVPAFPHGQREWSIDGQRVRYPGAFVYSQVFNLLGMPSATVPVGRSPEGMPIGVQIVALPYQDRMLLQVVCQLEAELRGTEEPLY